jgi:predicted AAA+ superfamily ATPase
LDVVHRLMGDTQKFFVLSGSSARKLKQGGANLLAGRALVYHLYPFSYFEIKDQFDLAHALQWGTLPAIMQHHSDEKRQKFLQSYSNTYLKEEIWGEQLVRKLEPFRRFLEVAAQCNGKIVSYSNIARDVGVDDKTVANYYSILEDTLIGSFIEPFRHSIRKRLSEKPKFYFFDTGVVRALSRLTSVPLEPRTMAYGNAFEHFIILECIKLCSLFQTEYQLTYLRTKDDVEIDLVIHRPGKPILCIEIKSAEEVNQKDISAFITISKDLPNSEAVCLCRERYPKKIEHVTVLPWQLGLSQLFLPKG